MSEIKVNSIKGVGASTAAITVNNTDGTCTAKITNNLSNRNKVINGSMIVSQRASSFTSTGEEYLIDRFKHSVGSSLNFDTTTTQESSGPDGFGNSLKITPDSAVTPSGSENGIIEQFIEGQNLQDLDWGTSSAKDITVSFYAKSAAQNANHQYTLWLQAYNSANNRFIQTKAFTVTASWQRFSLTFTGNTSENIINTNTVGLRVGWVLASGSDDIASAKTSWEDNNKWMSVTGTSNFMDNTSNEFHLTGVQLEVGSVATDFEHTTYAQELALCQRYYYMHADTVTTNIGVGCYYNASVFAFDVKFPTTMRAAPTLDYANGSGYYVIYANNTTDQFDAMGIARPSPRSAAIDTSTGTSGTQGHGGICGTNNSAAHIAFSSEL